MRGALGPLSTPWAALLGLPADAFASQARPDVDTNLGICCPRGKPSVKALQLLSAIYPRATSVKEGCPKLRFLPGGRPARPVLWETYSEPQHFVVLRVHGFALLSPTPGDSAGVRLGVKRDPPQLEYDVPLGLRGGTGRQWQASPLTQRGKAREEGLGLCTALAPTDL